MGRVSAALRVQSLDRETRQTRTAIHEKYGEIIRLAPDEVSFASEQAWNDIYASRRGHKRAGRDKAFSTGEFDGCYIHKSVMTPLVLNDMADNIFTTNDVKLHARARTILSNSFTEESLHTQHPLIEGHADLLVAKLHALSAESENTDSGALVNMTDWLNFFTMDVIGDLAFGESFGYLQTGEYHTWVRTLFNYADAMSLAAAPRYYPSVEFLFQKLIPKSVIEGQRQHIQYANKMINRRLELKTDRPDFMTPFMKNNPNFENMSRDEILSTFTLIIVAGSETTATTMTGIFNHLSRSERILQRLCREIRTKFKKETDITIDNIHDLPYLEAVLNEGLRMCNPVPGGLPRVVPEGGDTYAGVYLPGGEGNLPVLEHPQG